MNTKLWIGIIITAVVIVGITIAHNRGLIPVQIHQVPATETGTPTATATFYDQSTGEALPATFYSDRVTFTQTKLGTLTLPQTISADGGRYANTDESIVFWNKGNSVFITQNGTIIFNGSEGKPALGGAQGKLVAGSNPPADPKKLVGTWVWVRTTVRDAASITPKKPTAFAVTFTADGKVSGKTDCNGFGGDYRVGSDGVVTFGPFMSTLMYCEGSQESVFTAEMTKAHSYSFDTDGNLLISFDNNAGSIVFKKQ